MSGIEFPADLGDGITIRPRRRVYRTDPELWEVLQDGEPIGHLRAVRIGRAVDVFYEATAYMPGTGEEVSVEYSSSVKGRCEAILAFRADPWSSVHLPSRMRRPGSGWARPRAGDEEGPARADS